MHFQDRGASQRDLAPSATSTNPRTYSVPLPPQRARVGVQRRENELSALPLSLLCPVDTLSAQSTEADCCTSDGVVVEFTTYCGRYPEIDAPDTAVFQRFTLSSARQTDVCVRRPDGHHSNVLASVSLVDQRLRGRLAEPTSRSLCDKRCAPFRDCNREMGLNGETRESLDHTAPGVTRPWVQSLKHPRALTFLPGPSETHDDGRPGAHCNEPGQRSVGYSRRESSARAEPELRNRISRRANSDRELTASRAAHSKPSPLAGEGGAHRAIARCVPGWGEYFCETSSPHPASACGARPPSPVQGRGDGASGAESEHPSRCARHAGERGNPENNRTVARASGSMFISCG